MPKLHLAEMRLTVKAEADRRKMLVKITGHRECLLLSCGGTDDFLVTFIAWGSWI